MLEYPLHSKISSFPLFSYKPNRKEPKIIIIITLVLLTKKKKKAKREREREIRGGKEEGLTGIDGGAQRRWVGCMAENWCEEMKK